MIFLAGVAIYLLLGLLTLAIAVWNEGSVKTEPHPRPATMRQLWENTVQDTDLGWRFALFIVLFWPFIWLVHTLNEVF